ncbi:MAG: DUF373 family protein [Ferroplasma sp.]
MTTLILNVDRDNDYGVKAGIKGPLSGYGECYNAALKLISSDPEDSDSNALFGAIKVYEELQAKKENVEIALITGDEDVGAQSDEILAKQLEDVLGTQHYDDLILVSDGAEDDYIIPLISSRIKIRYVKHILIRHNENIESLYYYIVKGMKDKKISRKFTIPVGLLLLSYGIALLIFTIYYIALTRSYIIAPTTGAVMLVTIVLGFYFISRGIEFNKVIMRLLSNFKEYSQEAKVPLLSYVVSTLIIIIGITYSYVTISKLAILLNQIILFFTIMIWWIFAAFVSKELFDAFDLYIDRSPGMSKMWYGITYSMAITLIVYGMLNYIRYIVGLIPLSHMTIYIGFVVAGIVIALAASALHKYFYRIREKIKNTMEIK